MKIVMVTDTYTPRVNGVVRSTQSFAEQFRKHGHKVIVAAPAFPNHQDTEADVWRWPSHYLFFDPEDRLSNTWAPSARRLEKALAEFKPDIIHNQTPFSLGMASVRWAKAWGVPVVHTYHTLFEAYVHHYLRMVPEPVGRRWAAAFSRWYCNKHDLIIVPSSPMQEALQRYRITAPIAIVPTGIDLAPFKNVDGPRMRKQTGFAEDDIMLLVMGRVAREKNVPFLFDVLEQLIPKFPKARLVIAGQGPALEEIKALSHQRKLDDKVVYIGYLNRKDWADLYAAADLQLLSSVTETQGLVLTEAMAAGTPVVAVAEMGVRDVMAGGGGLAVKLDVAEFAAAVERMLTDQQLYAEKLKEAAKQAQDWSIEHKAEEMLGQYQRLIDRRKK